MTLKYTPGWSNMSCLVAVDLWQFLSWWKSLIKLRSLNVNALFSLVPGEGRLASCPAWKTCCFTVLLKARRRSQLTNSLPWVTALPLHMFICARMDIIGCSMFCVHRSSFFAIVYNYCCVVAVIGTTKWGTESCFSTPWPSYQTSLTKEVKSSDKSVGLDDSNK